MIFITVKNIENERAIETVINPQQIILMMQGKETTKIFFSGESLLVADTIEEIKNKIYIQEEIK